MRRNGVYLLAARRDRVVRIDTRQIREVLGTTAPQRVPLAPEYIAGVVSYRGEVLTTVSFRALLGLECRAGSNCILVFDGEQNENALD